MGGSEIGTCLVVPELCDKKKARPMLIVMHFLNAANGIVVDLAVSFEFIKVQRHVRTN